MRRHGFTIPELLIVIMIIGILVTIAIVSYNGYIARSHDTAVRSDLDSMVGLIESYRVDPDNPDQFPSTAAHLETLGIKATKTSYKDTIPVNLVYCLSTSGPTAYQAYKLIAESKSGAIYLMTQDGFKSHSLTQSDLTSGLCAAQGMTLVSNGMSSPGTWQTWVGSN